MPFLLLPLLNKTFPQQIAVRVPRRLSSSILFNSINIYFIEYLLLQSRLCWGILKQERELGKMKKFLILTGLLPKLWVGVRCDGGHTRGPSFPRELRVASSDSFRWAVLLPPFPAHPLSLFDH